MNILILNIGSSSIKYTFFQNSRPVIHDYIERVSDYEFELKKIFSKILSNYKIDAVGHRVVHGASISKSTIITPKLVSQLDKIKHLAPLHNIPELKGIKIASHLLPVPNVAIFDTSFHSSIPEYAYTYAIPKKIAEKHLIRRYGFHGPSHKFVSIEAAHILKKPLQKLRIITCHLGNGASICAIKNGKSVDTSMGFTPLEGLVMGSRSGDLDPAIVSFIQRREHLTSEEVESLLNKNSGLKGLCGLNDMRDIFKASSHNKSAKLALDVFCYRLMKYISSYIGVLNGVDAIVFTGGIGEHAYWVRTQVLKNFSHVGLCLDSVKNRKNSEIISSSNSKIKVLVIPTNEELMMCREVLYVLQSKG